MLFSSSVFLFLFLPVVLLVYYLPLRRWRQGQNVFLLLASLGFYAWGEPGLYWSCWAPSWPITASACGWMPASGRDGPARPLL